MNDIGSPPPLPVSLSSLYSSLDIRSKRLFTRVFVYLWGVLVPRSRRYGVLHLYWLVDMVRVKYGLNVADLSILTYLYQITEKGKLVINSRDLYFSSSLHHSRRTVREQLIKLRKSGYIVRSSRDHTLPYLQRSVSQQKVFIQLSGSGVALIHKLETDLYRLSYNTTLDDITTNNKEGQTTA